MLAPPFLNCSFVGQQSCESNSGGDYVLTCMDVSGPQFNTSNLLCYIEGGHCAGSYGAPRKCISSSSTCASCDLDGDSFGGGCGGDCLDGDNSTYPGGPIETGSLCSDGKDNDCDGEQDCAEDSCNNANNWIPGEICQGGGQCCGGLCTSDRDNVYHDNDKDGWGDQSDLGLICPGTTRPDYIKKNDAYPYFDCDDNDATIWQENHFYYDQDGDGYGTGFWNYMCKSSPPVGYTTSPPIGDDCKEGDATKYQYLWGVNDQDGDSCGGGPSTKFCTGDTLPSPYIEHSDQSKCSVEGDCDNNDATVWKNLWAYLDEDHDDHGTGDLTKACSGATLHPSFTYNDNTDCAPTLPNKWRIGYVYIDSDLDGYTSDLDGDGELDYDDKVQTCYGEDLPKGYTFTSLGIDCDDGNSAKWKNWYLYPDGDEDSYGSSTDIYYHVTICAGDTKPIGYSYNNYGVDCFDSDKTVWQKRLCASDLDGDKICGSTSTFCMGDTCPSGWIGPSSKFYCMDCNDWDPNIYGGAKEICYNKKDDNCNWIIDEGCPASNKTCTSPPCNYNYNSNSYYIVSDDYNFYENIGYGIKPSGIYFAKGINISFNYDASKFSSNPSLFKYNDSSFENSAYNISVLEEVNQTIGSEGGVIELGDIKFEIQSEDLMENVNFTLRKVNITLINNTINEEDAQPPLGREELETALVSMIGNWVMEENSMNIMTQFIYIYIIRALFFSS